MDDETKTLLEECAKAFEAIPIARDSRKMLKRMGLTPGAYAGNGSHILARQMAKEIRDFIGAH